MMNPTSDTWNRFCDAMDAHRRELAKIEKRNAQLQRETAEQVRVLMAQKKAAR